MSKTEVQSLVALILGRCDVVVLFFWAHGIPGALARLVAPDIVEFDEHREDEVPGYEAKQHFISPPIVWRIIGAINLLQAFVRLKTGEKAGRRVAYVRRDDRAGLTNHVVHRATDSSCSHRTSIPRHKRH